MFYYNTCPGCNLLRNSAVALRNMKAVLVALLASTALLLAACGRDAGPGGAASPDADRCSTATATITGTEGNDTIDGTDEPDVIFGLGGSDDIRAHDGDDVICGGPGDDFIGGGPGSDFIDGGEGEDTCMGGPGDNQLLNCE